MFCLLSSWSHHACFFNKSAENISAPKPSIILLPKTLAMFEEKPSDFLTNENQLIDRSKMGREKGYQLESAQYNLFHKAPLHQCIVGLNFAQIHDILEHLLPCLPLLRANYSLHHLELPIQQWIQSYTPSTFQGFLTSNGFPQKSSIIFPGNLDDPIRACTIISILPFKISLLDKFAYKMPYHDMTLLNMSCYIRRYFDGGDFL